MNAGEVVIETRVDSKQLEKDLKNLQKELMSLQKEQDKLSEKKLKLEADVSDYEKAKKAIEDQNDEMMRKTTTEEQGLFVLDLEEMQLKKLNQQYAEPIKALRETNNEIDSNNKKIEETRVKVEEVSNELNDVRRKSDLKDVIKDVGNQVTRTVRKVAGWGLALIGIRGAYSMIHNAMSQLTKENKQLSTDIDYIKWAIAQTLKPVIEYIVQLAMRAVQIVATLIKLLTGKNLFANASAEKFAESMKNANKSSSGIAGNLKDANKQLAGFDEMNVLSDTSSSGGGAGGGVEDITPSIDLSEMEELPKWLKWIGENAELVKTIIEGIGIALVALKLGELLKTLGLFSNLSLWQLVLGLGLIIAGIALAIKGVIDFINDPSWYNFLTILEGIALVVAGIAVLMGGWIVALVALGVALIAFVVQNWDKVKAVLGQVGSWIYDNVIKPVVDYFVGLWNKIVEILSPVIEFFKGIFKTVVDNIKIHIDNMKEIFKLAWEVIKKIYKPVVDYFKERFEGAVNKIKQVFTPIVDFFTGIWNRIKGKLAEFGAMAGEIVAGHFKSVVNGVLWAIETILNSPINAINKLIDVVRVVPGLGKLKMLNTFNLPRLAKGGIVNMPGRGVMVGGSAIAGERGQEGVIPLTDSQQMQLLGEAIGRYITINANIVNSMNGRVLSRELQRVQNENDFASNR